MTNPEPRRFEKNQIVYREGDNAPDFYVLLSGKLAVFRQRHFVRSISGRGIFVGEMGSLLGFKRSATVITLEPSSLIPIPNSVDKIFNRHVEIGVKLLESLRYRLSEMYDRAEKLWSEILEDVIEIIVYEAATKTAIRKTLSLGQIEGEKNSIRQAVLRELKSEDFKFSNLNEFLKTLDIEEEFNRHIKEKYPRFRYVDLEKMKDLWKKHAPDSTSDKLKHCIDLAAGLNDLTEFITSFGTQDESTGSEEISMLESDIPLAKRIVVLKTVSQNVLTPKRGIEQMKKLNRDIDVEIEEATRQEQRNGRVYPLSDFAKKLEIGSEYIEELRREFWTSLSKV